MRCVGEVLHIFFNSALHEWTVELHAAGAKPLVTEKTPSDSDIRSQHRPRSIKMAVMKSIFTNPMSGPEP